MNVLQKLQAFYTGLPIVVRILLFAPAAVIAVGAVGVWIWNAARMAQASGTSDHAAGLNQAAGTALGGQLGKLGTVVDSGGKLVSDAASHRKSDADLIREARKGTK